MIVSQPLPESPWGPGLAAYFVIVGIASGLTLIGSWRRLTWPRSTTAADHAAVWTSLGLLTVGALLLVLDLGRPDRFFLMLTRFDNLSSPISIGAKVLALKTFLLVVDLYLLQRARGARGMALPPGNATTRRVSVIVTVLLACCSMLLAIYPAAVLERTWTAPLAQSNGAMLLMLVTAVLLGAGVQWVLDNLPSIAPPSPARAALRLGLLTAIGLSAVAMLLTGLSFSADPTTTAFTREEFGPVDVATVWWAVPWLLIAAVPAISSPRRTRRLTSVLGGVSIVTAAALTRYLLFGTGP